MLSWPRVQNGFGFLSLTRSPSRPRLRILREPLFEVTGLAEDKLQSLINYVVDTCRAEKLRVPVERDCEWFLDTDVELSGWDLGIRWSEQRHHDSPWEIKKAESIRCRQM